MHTVCLSGWTQAVDALEGIVPGAQHIDYVLARTLEDVSVPAQCDVLIGWSLGGVLGRQLLFHDRIKAKAFVSIAAPLQFVRDDAFHPAMPQDTFEQFYLNFTTDQARTMRRFAGLLAKGDRREAQVRQAMRLHHAADQTEDWLRWLDYLRLLEWQPMAHALPPALHIHGEADVIVPYVQTEYISPQVEVMTLPECGHAPHYHDPQKVRDAIDEFYQKISA